MNHYHRGDNVTRYRTALKRQSNLLEILKRYPSLYQTRRSLGARGPDDGTGVRGDGPADPVRVRRAAGPRRRTALRRAARHRRARNDRRRESREGQASARMYN